MSLHPLKQLNAFAFEKPGKCITTYGNWVVYFKRDGLGRIINERAYFHTKKKALEFFNANAEGAK